MFTHVILFDDSRRDDLLPLTFTRPIALIRVGVLSIKDKWERMMNAPCSFFTVNYLRRKFPLPQEPGPFLFINGGVIPSPNLVEVIRRLKQGEAIVFKDTLIAAILPDLPADDFAFTSLSFPNAQKWTNDLFQIKHPWDIFSKNGDALLKDFDLLTKGRSSQEISSSNRVLGNHPIFIEEGAIIECSVINASNGPIYIGKNAEIMEGSLVRGPFALCNNSTLKMGAKIYGPTTIGPHCKVGGEVNNSVFFGYSNKAHDGFLGNSVIGEWCNLGADTNTSNLKNNYANVKLWNYPKGGFLDTGLQFCGLIMGDHSKCGINTMFNTGTIVGVSANIFGDGFPRNFISSFSWGGAQGFTTYKTNKAFETAQKVMERRGINLDEIEREILEHVFNITACFRH
ncbi:MAG: GlmU family protein [Bacteroidales bacterium]